MLQRRKSLTKFGRRLFTKQTYPTSIRAVHETARLQMPSYRPPSYNAVRTRLLTAKRVDVEKVEEKLGNSIGKYGVTICCNGWDNVQNRPLLNVVQCGSNGDLFLGIIDTTGNHKDHQYIASQIHPFLEKSEFTMLFKFARTMLRL